MPNVIKHQQIKTELLIECIAALKGLETFTPINGRAIHELVSDLEVELNSNRSVSTEVIATESESIAFDLGFAHASQKIPYSTCHYEQGSSEADYYVDGYYSGEKAIEFGHIVKIKT